MISTENMETFEQEPLLAQDSSPLIKNVQTQATGWTTIYRRKIRVVFLPHQLLEWIYDHIPHSPIPKDAMFHRLQFDGREKYMVFDFLSFDAPEVKAIKVTYDEMTKMFQTILRNRLPVDLEMCGLYRSPMFAHLMIEFASSRCAEQDVTVQMRYENRELVLTGNGPFTKERV